MATLSLLERAQALDYTNHPAVVAMDEDILAAWRDDDVPMVVATCKALVARGDGLPLLSRAQYHLMLSISEVEIYPGARLQHLRAAHLAVQ